VCVYVCVNILIVISHGASSIYTCKCMYCEYDYDCDCDMFDKIKSINSQSIITITNPFANRNANCKTPNAIQCHASECVCVSECV